MLAAAPTGGRPRRRAGDARVRRRARPRAGDRLRARRGGPHGRRGRAVARRGAGRRTRRGGGARADGRGRAAARARLGRDALAGGARPDARGAGRGRAGRRSTCPASTCTRPWSRRPSPRRPRSPGRRAGPTTASSAATRTTPRAEAARDVAPDAPRRAATAAASPRRPPPASCPCTSTARRSSTPGTGSRRLLELTADAAERPAARGRVPRGAVQTPTTSRAARGLPGLTGIGGDLNVDGSIGSRTARPADARTPTRPGPARRARRAALYLRADQIATHLRAVRARRRPGGASTSSGTGRWTRCSPGSGAPRRRGAGPRARRGSPDRARGDGRRADARRARAARGPAERPAGLRRGVGRDGGHVRRAAGRRARRGPSTRSPTSRPAGSRWPSARTSPVTPFDPWGAVRAAVHTTRPEQRISARAAFRAHTRGGWRAAGLDHTGAGELRLGAPATSPSGGPRAGGAGPRRARRGVEHRCARRDAAAARPRPDAPAPGVPADPARRRRPARRPGLTRAPPRQPSAGAHASTPVRPHTRPLTGGVRAARGRGRRVRNRHAGGPTRRATCNERHPSGLASALTCTDGSDLRRRGLDATSGAR